VSCRLAFQTDSQGKGAALVFGEMISHGNRAVRAQRAKNAQDAEHPPSPGSWMVRN
jgi:hypothetical protein